jgi:cellulose synthase operon protein C
VLRVRVIKPSGQVLEPQIVSGKPTLTMPHLEVGDYIETEHIVSQSGTPGGLHYRGPTWFFREADKGYWRSEFVCVTPKEKALQVELRGGVLPPQKKDLGTFEESRWIVNESPPAVAEAGSPPAGEFLPSVRIGWGIDLDNTLASYVDAVNDETPLDPRLRAQMLAVSGDVKKQSSAETMQKVYRSLVAMVEPGREADGRRVITGKSGSLQAAFLYSLRLLGLPVEYAIVKDKLAMPPKGKLSEVESWDNLVIRAGSPMQWFVVRDKFTPFGYLPPELRGQPAIVLTPGLARMTTPSDGGGEDAFLVEGRAELQADASANLTLKHTYTGRLASRLRSGLEQVPPAKLREVVESQLLNDSLPGVKVEDVEIDELKNIDAPLSLRIRAKAPRFARLQGDKLAVRVVFPVDIGRYVALASRTTPLLLSSATKVSVKMQVVVPAGLTPPASLSALEIRDADRIVILKDRIEGRVMMFDRSMSLPAGRIEPGAPYEEFTKFARKADSALGAEVLLGR